jgi:hypothetical protein
MANRHANKKLRSAIRARMAKTGEGYQRARERICARHVRVSLTPATMFGQPRAIATIEMHGMVVNVVVGSTVLLRRASGLS